MNKDDGVSIVMVTHNLDIVKATDRVVKLVGGRVAEEPVERLFPPRLLSAVG